MPEPTVLELLRLDEILAGGMPELRFRRLYAAFAVKFAWPFCGDDGYYVEDAALAWKRWGGLEVVEEEYTL